MVNLNVIGYILGFSRYHMNITNNHALMMCNFHLDEDVSDVGDVRQAEHTCPTALHRPPLPPLKTSLGPLWRPGDFFNPVLRPTWITTPQYVSQFVKW